jgi:hypothetical protein
MSELQKWATIGALWVFAAGILLIGIGQRIKPISNGAGPGYGFDQWTGRSVLMLDGRKINE